MLCSTVLSLRNDNHVSYLRLFDEPLCRCVWTIPSFLDAGLIALRPNLFGLNTLNDVLKNGSSAFLNDSEAIFPIFSPSG